MGGATLTCRSLLSGASMRQPVISSRRDYSTRVKKNLSFGGVPLCCSLLAPSPWDALSFSISMGSLTFDEGACVLGPRSCGHASTVGARHFLLVSSASAQGSRR